MTPHHSHQTLDHFVEPCVRLRKRAIDQRQEPGYLGLPRRELVGGAGKRCVERTEGHSPPPRHTKQELPVDRVAQRARRRRQARDEIERLGQREARRRLARPRWLSASVRTSGTRRETAASPAGPAT